MKQYRFNAVIIIFCLLMVMSITANGKIKNFDYPALGTIEVPEPEKIILDNGMTIYLMEDHDLPQFDISVNIRKCGSYIDPPGKTGLASMTGTVMRTGGTANMAGDLIDEEMEAIGAYVETGIGTISGSAAAGGLSDYTDKIVSILADVLQNPIFGG